MIQIIDNCISKEDQDKIELICTGVHSGFGKNLKEEMLLPWYFHSTANYPENPEHVSKGTLSLIELSKTKYYDPPQFTHTVFEEPLEGIYTDYFVKTFLPILSKISVDLFRMKLNINFAYSEFPKNAITGPHIDFIQDIDGMGSLSTAVYYVNDSDGDTIIFDGKYNKDTEYTDLKIKQRISPKKGRIVMFDSEYIHAASLPSSGKRIVLNINYRSGENK